METVMTRLNCVGFTLGFRWATGPGSCLKSSFLRFLINIYKARLELFGTLVTELSQRIQVSKTRHISLPNEQCWTDIGCESTSKTRVYSDKLVLNQPGPLGGNGPYTLSDCAPSNLRWRLFIHICHHFFVGYLNFLLECVPTFVTLKELSFL